MDEKVVTEMKSNGRLREFMEQAQQRLALQEANALRQQIVWLAKMRTEWGQHLDHIRAQLPDVLREFVVVTDPEVMDEMPDYARQGHVQLQVPGCAPITFEFAYHSWNIKAFWPRRVVSIEEADDGIPYLASQAYEKIEDIYIAVATARNNYARWSALEAELDWRLEATRSMQEMIDAQGCTSVTLAPVYGIDGAEIDI